MVWLFVRKRAWIISISTALAATSCAGNGKDGPIDGSADATSDVAGSQPDARPDAAAVDAGEETARLDGSPDVRDSAALDAPDAIGSDRAIDAEAGGAPDTSGCTGPVFQGSFVITNALDVQTIHSYAVITGDVAIEAPGLTSISLPSLCELGGRMKENNAPDLVTLDLPALTSAGGLDVQGAPLKTAHLDRLEKVTTFLSIAIDGAISIPSLASSPALEVLGVSSSTRVDLPKLRSVAKGIGLACFTPDPCGSVTANALLSAGRVTANHMDFSAMNLATVGELVLYRATSRLPSLASITGGLGIERNGEGPDEFPALASIGEDLTLHTAAPSASFPALVTIKGYLDILATSTAPSSVSLPVLKVIGGSASPVVRSSVRLAGSFYAPALESVNGELILANVSSFDLSSLASVGGPLTVDSAAPSTSFPKLGSVAGAVTITGTAAVQSVSLPALASFQGPASVTIPGAFSAPAVAIAKNDLTVRNVSSLDLSSLASVEGSLTVTMSSPVSLPALSSIKGPVNFYVDTSFHAPALVSANGGGSLRVSDLEVPALKSVGSAGTASRCDAWLSIGGLTAATLQLPALESGCLQLGNAGSTVCSANDGANPSLVQILAPKLTRGAVWFYNNPMLPKCRADALAAQLAPALDQLQEYCPLAPGPCP